MTIIEVIVIYIKVLRTSTNIKAMKRSAHFIDVPDYIAINICVLGGTKKIYSPPTVGSAAGLRTCIDGIIVNINGIIHTSDFLKQ